MTLKGPNASELQDLARSLGIGLTDAEAGEYAELLAPMAAMADAQQKMPDYLPAVKYPRTPGYRPDGEENRYNAWYYKTRIEGAQDGKLKGKTVALKDNVMLAGVPMMNGTSILEGYVPEVDATIATRLLDAGATILGKAHCENYCLSGSSHTNATGPCHNPHRTGYSAGGSSSGSAALVAAGEVDMAIGGDQGGSIRMPASFCGIYGHEADLRPRALYRGAGDRGRHRPCRADDGERRRQRADAGGHRGSGRYRRTPARRGHAPLLGNAGGRGFGTADRGDRGRVRPPRLPGGVGCGGPRRLRQVRRARRGGRDRRRSRCIARPRSCTCRRWRKGSPGK